MPFQTLRGFKDILPPESEAVARLETAARSVFRTFGFREIRLPTLESRELFVKSTGETTDIVEKEMFLLEDSGERKLAMRPEGTPGAVRAFLQHHMTQQGGRSKLFYIGGMFRAERPQAGRFREFEQIGAECFANAHPAADVESILALMGVLDEAGLKEKYALHLNNLGCEDPDCRPAYRKRLLNFLEGKRAQLCEHCQKRLSRNPLRVLDCKGDRPRLDAEGGLPHLEPCAACLAHFERAAKFLQSAGAEFQVDPALVRGLDYYTRVVFEVKSKALGAQDALAGGGRYDGLVKLMGGPDTPAVGWALGVERVLLAAGTGKNEVPPPSGLIYVATQAAHAPIETAALRLLQALRARRLAADGGLFGHSLKSQMREADRLGARYVVIFGEREFEEGRCGVKDMAAKDAQELVSMDKVESHLAERLQKNG